jgi:hypothetical protein
MSFGQSVGQAPLDFKENFRKEATISGALFAGIQRFDGRFNPKEDLVSVEVPASWAGGYACLRVTTANGLYDSLWDYEIPENATILSLEFPTSHGQFLAERPIGGVAALITQGLCASPPGDNAIVRWNADDSTPVLLFLNAFRADRVFVYIGSDPTPIECAPLTTDVRTAYDVQCDLGALVSKEPVVLEIFSISNGQASEPTSLTLLTADIR